MTQPAEANSMQPRLREERIAAFRGEGYLMHLKPVLPPSEFESLKTYWNARTSLADPELQVHFQPHFTAPELFDWIFADEILDLVEPILGPDIAFFLCHLLSKPPLGKRQTPWHRDCAYWRGIFSPLKFCVVSLSLEAATRENGCTEFIPGSHRLRHRDDVPRRRKGLEIFPARWGDGRSAPAEMGPNQASLHHGCLVHGGGPNTTPIGRRSLFMFFMSARSRFELAGPLEIFRPYLARGRGLAGNRYADPGRKYDELARTAEIYCRRVQSLSGFLPQL